MKRLSATPSRTIYRNSDLDRITGLSRTTRWRLEKSGQFPARRRLTGGTAVGWLADEVDAWVAERAKA